MAAETAASTASITAPLVRGSHRRLSSEESRGRPQLSADMLKYTRKYAGGILPLWVSATPAVVLTFSGRLLVYKITHNDTEVLQEELC